MAASNWGGQDPHRVVVPRIYVIYANEGSKLKIYLQNNIILLSPNVLRTMD